ncbi:MAG TPA: preprotein translocase subunit SecA [Candidatus Binatia bacterium]
MEAARNLHSAYPERAEAGRGRIEEFCGCMIGPFVRETAVRWLGIQQFVQRVGAIGNPLRGAATKKLVADARELGRQVRRAGYETQRAARAFALVRELANRTLGLRHFDVQLIGGWVLLNGMVAEMDTGEGKTLTATLPACTAALAGIPVHVVTVNDYLAKRDAELMKPLYASLGLTVGIITQGMEPRARRRAYDCDVTYCTNKEVVFDYLKDRIVLGNRAGRLRLQLERLSGHSRLDQLLLRGLHFAIIDEADSILIDEARTPLIISDANNTREFDRTVYKIALQVAAQLEEGRHFVVEHPPPRIELTPSGRRRIFELVPGDAAIWNSPAECEDLLRQALTARHLMQRDTHYLVRDGKIEIIDEYTGRTMADRSWEHGLHQLIESKEKCAISPERGPLSRISYQRFFRRYLRLAGMTGTAREVRGELWSVYRLPVVRVPTNRRAQRRQLGDRICATAEAKWEAVLARVVEIRAQNRPVLIGTRSVAASEELSRLMKQAEIPHRVLNARHDAEEAAIISQAGQAGCITIATNMAGRGTDIRLTPDIAHRGGLHVIATERHEARRIDRQLFGRCGRQGDRGSYEFIVSLEDELFRRHENGVFRFIGVLIHSGQPVGHWLGILAFRWIQHTTERLHSRIRRELLNSDDRLQSALAFSGRFE